MRQSLYDYCAEHGKTGLLWQWDTNKNAPLTPQTISYGSKQKVWWACESGHHWQAVVYTRTGRDSGCPYCIGKKPCPGENDLASQLPDLAVQWHPSKNSITPDNVTVGSHYLAWWVCEKGHEWQAMVKTRAAGCGCPYCSNRVLLPGENDLTTTYPDLARQWHPTKNRTLMPCDIVAGSQRKVWWQCEKGHEWQAVINARVSGNGCPVCAGKRVISGENDLASRFPYIAAQWHPTRNGDLSPKQIAVSSNRKVWWRCPLGHDYQAMVGHRTSKSSGCPYCAGRRVMPGFNDLATVEPGIAAQWHPTLNDTLIPEQVTAGSNRKVWWECPNGHVWKAAISSRARGKKCGCPVCAGKINPERQARYQMTVGELP